VTGSHTRRSRPTRRKRGGIDPWCRPRFTAGLCSRLDDDSQPRAPHSDDPIARPGLAALAALLEWTRSVGSCRLSAAPPFAWASGSATNLLRFWGTAEATSANGRAAPTGYKRKTSSRAVRPLSPSGMRPLERGSLKEGGFLSDGDRFASRTGSAAGAEPVEAVGGVPGEAEAACRPHSRRRPHRTGARPDT
jgi:hypothetical protein